jgi:HK97 family phage portal protein
VGILSQAFETRTHPAQNIDWHEWWGIKPTTAGVHVNHNNSLEQSTVFACVRVLSETVASLPFILYRRRGRGKDRATDHPLFSILRYLPNPEMTAFEFWETLMGHVATWGNAYSEIELNNGGRVRGLWPLRVDRMKVERREGKLWYIYRLPTGTPVELPSYRIMHIRGLGFDGVVGYDPISLARQAIALGMGTEEFGARFFANGAQPGLVLSHPGLLSKEAKDRLAESVEKRHQGLTKAHRIMVLEEGLKAEQIGIPPENAQFLETRKFQVPEIARFWRMPLHKIGYLEQATFSNIEHQSIEFVTDTIDPWLVRGEQAIYRDLLMPKERQEFFAEHLVDALLRGDIQSRYQAYATGRQNGWLSANDIREKENMNPVEGGDVYLVPLNMVPADEVGGGAGQRSVGDQETRSLNIEERSTRIQNLIIARRRLRSSYERLIHEAADRVVRREVADVRRALGKYLGKRDEFQFATWLKEFYEGHKAFWQRQILPVLLSYADQVGVSVADELGGDAHSAEDIRDFIDQYAQALATRQAGSSHLQLQAILDEKLQAGEDPEPALRERLDEWEEKRANKITRAEVTGALGAFSQAYYVLVGVKRKTWVAMGDSCPYCQALNGRTVEIEKFFIEKDTDFQPDGVERPISIRYNVGHAPAHGGCDCMIMAEV